MKINHLLVFIVLLGYAALFAQSSEIMKVDVRANPENAQELDLNIEFQLGTEYQDGFYIEMPEGLTTVVKSVKRNEENFWLVNSETPIEQKNVIAWYSGGNGIYVHYTLDDLSGTLNIELVPDNKKLKRFDTLETKLYPVTREAENIVVQETETARSNVSLKQTIQGNE